MTERTKVLARAEKADHTSERIPGGARRSNTVIAPSVGTSVVPRTADNLTVQRLFQSGLIQPKLTINQPGDPYEQEADRVADRVVSSAPAGLIQRKCECTGGPPCAKCAEEQVIQTKRRSDAHGFVPTGQMRLFGGGGNPLPTSVRSHFEPRFGRDFGQVRVHTDHHSADSARSIQARAFTSGSDIAFGRGEYSPDSSEGRRLIAHELAHVVQQGRGGPNLPNVQRAGMGDVHLAESKAGSPDIPPPGTLTPLPSPSLIEKRAPETGGDQIKFEGVLLSTSTEFVQYQLEQMIASDGLMNAESFVRRLTASPQSDEGTLKTSEKQREDIKTEGSLPGGTPLPVETEDEIRHRLANKDRVLRVIPVVQSEFKLLRTESDEFLEDFETIARTKMFNALVESQTRVEGEAKRYGLSPADLYGGPELRTTAFPKPRTPADVAQEMRGQQSDAARYSAAKKPRQELIKAAQTIRSRRQWVEGIEAQLQAIRNPRGTAAFPKPRTALDEVKEMRIEEELRKAKLSFNELVRDKQREFPVLAAFMRDDGGLDKVADAKDDGLKVVLLEQVNEKLKNIFETRQNMTSGKITPWEIPFVVEGTRRFMKIDKGTMRGKVLDDRYEQKKQEKVDEKDRWQAISTLSLALGLLAIIPTPFSPFLAGASTVLNVAVAAHDLDEYIVQSAASGTDFDKALAISQEDPSLFWLAVELIGTALDVGMAAKSLKGISALKSAVVAGEEGAAKALEAEASKLGPQVAKRVVAEAEAARQAAIKEGRAAGKAGQLIEEEAITAGKLAEDSFEHGGHTYQILKDGRIVRCSKWCTELGLAFRDLFKRNAHLAEELEKIRGLKGKAAKEAAASLTERMEQIRKAENMSLEELEKLIDKGGFEKGTVAGDDLRFVRYQKKGGELDFKEWFSSSRGGRLGGPEHQEIVADIIKKYPSTTQEASVGSRFADAYTPAEKGKKAIFHQVGDINVRGDPIARERRAIDAIRKAPGGQDADIIFYPKDKSTPLMNPDRNPKWAATWSVD